jgi:L-ribulose-5-phosphate 3-epimerase UlaE
MPVLDTVAKAMGFVRQVDSPWLQIYLDIGNITNACGDISAVLADLWTGRGHIAAAHLKETMPGVFRDLFPGEGQVVFPAVIGALKAQGVRRFTAECWVREGDSWQARIRAVRDFYRPLLDMGKNQ